MFILELVLESSAEMMDGRAFIAILQPSEAA
jgi:hypothetical protein